MSQSQPRKKSERLPYDVVYDIFTRLAVKSLMRFRDHWLLLFSVTILIELSGKCHIWVMREYGVVESWTKKSVPNGFGLQDFYGCTDNGELLIENATGLVSLDPESLNENKLAIEDAQWMAYTPNSMESLVLLDGLNVSSEYED
uniref:F-box associated domain-containing protein n=1 Tax=Fagus sylvatica TaxID=28930 RepID=A0A2N9FNF2_FAGSY